jgi:hypothetical protein
MSKVILKKAERVDLEVAAAPPMRVKARRSGFPVTPPNNVLPHRASRAWQFPPSEANRPVA